MKIHFTLWLISAPILLFIVGADRADALFCTNNRERCEKDFPRSFSPRYDYARGYQYPETWFVMQKTCVGSVCFSFPVGTTDYKIASPTWPRASSGGDGKRYCLSRICSPFHPNPFSSTVETGTAEKTGSRTKDTYYTWADINVDIKWHDQISAYQWGTYVYKPNPRLPGVYIYDWRYWSYYLSLFPTYFIFTDTTPCGFSKNQVQMMKTYVVPSYRYDPQKPPKPASWIDPIVPARYNFHTDKLHTAIGLSLCVLRLHRSDDTIFDILNYVEPKKPPKPDITFFGDYYKKDSVGGETWISPGSNMRVYGRVINSVEMRLLEQEKNKEIDILDPKDKYWVKADVERNNIIYDRRYTLIAENAGGTTSATFDVKIAKPFITGLTANGVPKKIELFIGQKFELQFATENAEQIWLSGVPEGWNDSGNKYITSGSVTITPRKTTTYTLQAWNHEWDYADRQSVEVVVHYIDVAKVIHCGSDSLIKAFTTGLTIGLNFGAIAASIGSLAPGVGTVVGGVGGFLAGLITGGVIGVINFVTCYFFDFYIGPDVLASLQKGLISGGLSVQGRPSFIPPAGPPTINPLICPPGKCNFGDGPPPPIIIGSSPKGNLIVNEGGADPKANFFQKIVAENSAKAHVDLLKSSTKVPGHVELPKGFTLENNQAQAILGHCGPDEGCLRNDIKAAFRRATGGKAKDVKFDHGDYCRFLESLHFVRSECK